MKDIGFNITANANMKTVDFLDIHLDLKKDIYQPYMKPNAAQSYVHRDSNHPRGILENIPRSINRRLSTLSANKQVFDSACPPYQEALQKSGYDFKLTYEPPSQSTKGKKDKGI